MNSLEYWDKRWQSNGSFDGSWPDSFARLLELGFIWRALPVYCRSILEPGCGPLSLDEHHRIARYIREPGRDYTGIDSSESALRIARARYPQAAFVHANLEDLGLFWPKADVIICRRVIQNLAPAHRARVIDLLYNYPRGILIEGTLSGLQAINVYRDKRDLEALAEPQYNSYLNAAEETALLKLPNARKFSFMSVYYEHTRGKQDLKNWNSALHERAYHEQLSSDVYAEGYGPVQGFTWGK